MLMEQIFNDGFWSISGAVVGAFLGALFGFIVSIFLDYRRSTKLEKCLYKEADFVSSYMSSFLISVVNENDKLKINLNQGDSFSAPREINFDVFNILYLELYKTKKIPTDDHRRFVHNVSYQWEQMFSLDKDRIERVGESAIYKINRGKCKDVIYILVGLLYYFDLFISKKGKFKFDENSDFRTMANLVFSKYQINNEDLINIISNETAHW
ncbi:hypothetical protein GCM10007855_40460 [Aliivibrio sifiae]|uniref:Uncharacterized protein n=2 Tax=Aliivibrio sifiae TaxID=566293 RepID=A0ABQ6AM40_9GAMM|nr:hypothetical protein GCM10007855_40460 [Aliivibrio sifiae]